MKNLIYKEFKLSISKFFIILPILLSALMFIPNWIFLLVFMYFFWISVPQIFSAYIANRDYNFTASLPIRRQDIVTSKAYSIFLLEAFHLVLGIIFGIAHNMIYGSWNLFMDINLSFFGIVILLFGVFNIVFLPAYFKTAHHFGKPAIYGTIATLIYGFIIEFSVAKWQFARDILEGSFLSQIIPFVVTAALGVTLSIVAVRKSKSNFMKIDL